MVKKTQASSADQQSAAQLAGAVKESAQQIWLAGLGAFSKAQEEGSRVFETLVKEGLSIQRKTQAAAEEGISETSARMASMASMASEFQSKAGNQWGKLENIFEERVAKAMEKLGVPSAKTVESLRARIEQLEEKASPKARARTAARSSAPVLARKATATPASGRSAAKKTRAPATTRKST